MSKKPLLDRLRYDGISWAQPLFNEAADRIADLERLLARMLEQIDVRETTIERLEWQVEEWRKANLPIVSRCSQAERQLAEARAALEPFASFDCEDFSDDMRLFEDVPSPTIGDMRRARTALDVASSNRKPIDD